MIRMNMEEMQELAIRPFIRKGKIVAIAWATSYWSDGETPSPIGHVYELERMPTKEEYNSHRLAGWLCEWPDSYWVDNLIEIGLMANTSEEKWSPSYHLGELDSREAVILYGVFNRPNGLLFVDENGKVEDLRTNWYGQ